MQTPLKNKETGNNGKERMLEKALELSGNTCLYWIKKHAKRLACKKNKINKCVKVIKNVSNFS